jgi:hypothetical protein
MVAMMIFRTEGILPPLPRKYPIAKMLGREGSA